MSHRLFHHRKFISTLLWAAGTGAALWSSPPARAQNCYLEYTYIGEASDGAADPGQEYVTAAYNPVQSTNALPFAASATVGRSGTSVSGSVGYGTLQFAGTCSVSNNFDDGYVCNSDFGGWQGNACVFADTLWFTSATLANGAPVVVRITTVYSGAVSTGGYAGDDYNNSTSTSLVLLNVSGSEQTASLPAEDTTNALAIMVAGATGPYPNTGGSGNACNFTASLTASGSVNDDDGAPYTATISASLASQTYVDVLTPGVTYASSSGTIYPTLIQPLLSIAPATNGARLFWPVTTATYRLEQNNDLTTTNWVATTNSVTILNGTNQVSVTCLPGGMFYRLVNP